MRKGQDLFDVTSAVLTAMRDVYCHAKPDLVLVHGDTTSAMGASLAHFIWELKLVMSRQDFGLGVYWHHFLRSLTGSA